MMVNSNVKTPVLPFLLLSVLCLLNTANAVLEYPKDKFNHQGALTGSEDCALLSLVVDESGSMMYEHDFLANSAVPMLVADFKAKKYNHIFICSHGFGSARDSRTDGFAFHGCTDASAWSEPPTPGEKGSIMGSWRVLGGVEDSYLGIMMGIENTPGVIDGYQLNSTCGTMFKDMILLTDEDRDVFKDNTITKADVASSLASAGYVFNAIVNIDMSSPPDKEGFEALGFFPSDDQPGKYEFFVPYGSNNGNYTTLYKDEYLKYLDPGLEAGKSVDDYTSLAVDTLGSVYDLGMLRLQNADYTDVFVKSLSDTQVREITKKNDDKSKQPPKKWKPDTSSCQPPAGKTYLTIGQDFFSIEEYLLSQYNASLEDNILRPMSSFEPAATMFYTDIQELRGLSTTIDYGSGIEYAGALQEAFPKSGIQIGLWLNGTSGCQDIVDGVLDLQIGEMYQQLERLHVPKVFLRVGYEFDNPWFGYSGDPLVYKEAFQYMVQACEDQLSVPGCHRVVSFVWHSWAAPKVAPLQDFYPGDDFVDWIGISIFQQLYPWANAENNGDFAGGTLDQVQEVLEFAKAHDKRVMIAESTPFGGMQFEGQPPPEVDFDWKNKADGTAIEKDIWDLWFQPTLDLIEQYDIGMWSYINCDWNSQPMWAGVGFGDTRISSDPKVMSKWREQVLGNPRFLTKMDCWSNIHEQYKNHYTPAMHATSAPAGTQGPMMMRANASLYDFSLSVILPAILVFGILYMLASTLRRLYCKFRIDEADTHGTIDPTEAEVLIPVEAPKEAPGNNQKTLYGATSNTSSENNNSGRWSVNL